MVATTEPDWTLLPHAGAALSYFCYVAVDVGAVVQRIERANLCRRCTEWSARRQRGREIVSLWKVTHGLKESRMNVFYGRT